ncbi:hypothetical protein [Aquirhabdus sp.]|uniref:hypothetical protein n=1 Tax=Aquirhabdus sp. TaxID=2824160 RepID=UPI00396CC249
MQDVSFKKWFIAWLNIINEPQGWREKLCQLFSLAAIATLCLYPFMGNLLLSELSGNTPPTVPLISSTGNFEYVSNPSNHSNHYDVYFHTHDGKTYQMSQFVAPLSVTKLAENNPTTQFKVQGFILANGKGSFYPVIVNDLNDYPIISKESLLAELAHNRQADQRTVNLMYSATIFCFVGFIIFSFLTINRKLSTQTFTQ